MTSIAAQLRQLNRHLADTRPRCPTCGNWPTRLVGLDPETEEETSETMPATGCPTCGRPVRYQVCIVGVDVTAL